MRTRGNGCWPRGCAGKGEEGDAALFRRTGDEARGGAEQDGCPSQQQSPIDPRYRVAEPFGQKAPGQAAAVVFSYASGAKPGGLLRSRSKPVGTNRRCAGVATCAAVRRARTRDRRQDCCPRRRRGGFCGPWVSRWQRTRPKHKQRGEQRRQALRAACAQAGRYRQGQGEEARCARDKDRGRGSHRGRPVHRWNAGPARLSL